MIAKKYLVLKAYKQMVSEEQRLDDIRDLGVKILTGIDGVGVELTIFGVAVYVPEDRKEQIIKIANRFSCDILDTETDQILDIFNSNAS